jgi:outer membrane protein
MNTQAVRNLLFSVIAICISQPAMSEFSLDSGNRPLTLGLGAMYRDKPYKNFSSSKRTNLVPVVLYEGEHFFARGSTIGWDFLDSSVVELAVIGEFIGEGYESSDSKFLKGMSDRDPTLGLGGHIIWKPENLGLKAVAVTDIAGNSNGTQLRGEVFYTHRTGDWMFKPTASIVWQDENFNDYYYGVRTKEINPFIRRAPYSADSDINYRIGTFAVYQQKASPWMFLGGVLYNFLGDEIEDSSIVDEDNELIGLIGVAYTLGK